MIDKYAITGLAIKNKKRRTKVASLNIPHYVNKRIAQYVKDFDRINYLVPGGTLVKGEMV